MKLEQKEKLARLENIISELSIECYNDKEFEQKLMSLEILAKRPKEIIMDDKLDTAIGG
jgi:hypothetical protein